MIPEVINMNEILKQALLYDFYGELLNEHQKNIYEQFVLEDLSLSEIAQGAGISRQGVHDMIKRCDRTLLDYESKLHLVARFLSIKEKVHRIDSLLEEKECGSIPTDKLVKDIKKISGEILEEL